MPLHVSSTSAHRQEGKIVLYSLWYHHTYRWPSGAQVERGDSLANIFVTLYGSGFLLTVVIRKSLWSQIIFSVFENCKKER